MKTKRTLIIVALLVAVMGLMTVSLALAGDDGANSFAQSGITSNATGSQGVSAGGAITITHSTDPVTVVPGSVACSPDMGASTTENSYWRVFDLAGDFGIVGNFDVSNVQFGVENAVNSGSTTVNLYTLSGVFTTANLTLIGTGSFNIADGSLFLYDAPVAGTVPAGSTLVVEISSPDLSGVGVFYIGSNPSGQTDPSYISSGSCGITQPTDFAAIGFPNVHIIINVSGTETAAQAPDIAVSKTPATQDVTSGGNADFTITVTNTGDVDLDNVTVTDALVPACDNAVGSLSVGAANTYSCTDVGVTSSYTNVVSVTSQLVTGAPGPSASASAVVNVNAPTSVSLAGFEGSGGAFSPIMLAAILAVILGAGFVVRRKLTA